MKKSELRNIIGEEIAKLHEYDEWASTRIQSKNIFRMLKQKYNNNIPDMKRGLEDTLKQNRIKSDQAEIVWQEFNKYFKIKEGVSELSETKFIGFYNGQKHETEATSLWDAKQKFIANLKIPKSKQGLLAVKSAGSMEKQDFKFEGKINEIDYKSAVESFNADLEKNSQIITLANHYNKSPKEIVKALQPRLTVLRYIDKSIKSIKIDFLDTNSKTKVYMLHTFKQNESTINEEFAHIIEVDTPTQVVSKPIAAQIEKLAKQGVRSKDIGLKMNFTGNEKLAFDTFHRIKNEIYFKLDKK
jgi:hypothetical protein